MGSYCKLGAGFLREVLIGSGIVWPHGCAWYPELCT